VRGARKKSREDEKMLTEEKKHKYLASPYLCPYCGSDELTLGKATADVNRAVQNISCRQCKKRWTNFYALAHIEEDEWDMRKGGIKPKSSSEAE
jgi:transcription elongation factor Elf1